MKEEDFYLVKQFKEDRDNICSWLRNMDFNRKSKYKIHDPHKDAVEWLMRYRRKEMVEAMIPMLEGMLEITEQKLSTMGVQLSPVKTIHEDQFSGVTGFSHDASFYYHTPTTKEED